MTTTDPFADAARAEAESWIGMDLDDHDNFVSGAEWARAHLSAQEPRRKTVLDYWDEHERTRAAQEPTDAEVEAAARALWAMQWATSWDEYSWGREPASPTGNDLRAVQVRRARAALTASRAVGRDAR